LRRRSLLPRCVESSLLFPRDDFFWCEWNVWKFFRLFAHTHFKTPLERDDEGHLGFYFFTFFFLDQKSSDSFVFFATLLSSLRFFFCFCVFVLKCDKNELKHKY
jgi:hypothetical protein